MGTNCSGVGVAEAASVHDSRKSANTRNLAVDHSKIVVLLEGRTSNTLSLRDRLVKICDASHDSHRVNFDFGNFYCLLRSVFMTFQIEPGLGS